MGGKLRVNCPVCGRSLFKGSKNSELECNCPKGNSYLTVNFVANGISVIVKEENKLTGSGISGEECKALGNG